ncbi:serine hydrolase [Pedobacter yonginense]|uniref:Serine hydrolase n=1 Tax=Pedobacter yonginense TaxID=651869 RepID=A0A317ESA4_9SPHI|nr:serine hydrolase [Pedobacter yonginense]PWS28743.1 serine hydrolase [Pedobacter yonginense]
MKNAQLLLLLISMLFVACKKNNTDPTPTNSDALYFPPNNATEWETKPMSALGWKQAAVDDLKKFLIDKNTKSFIILVNGRIVMEEYFNGHTQADTWAWNSAGKTLVSAATGIAQQEGLLNINNPASQYLGAGWTSEPSAKENLITVRNLLTMTSGLDESSELVIKSNLTYVADAGTRWAYANVFQKLMDVVAAASKQPYETYFNSKIKNKLGMDGFWDNGLIFKIYNSNTRSMARFGLLALNSGKWNQEQIINESFFSESIKSSQSINPSYGYLWWLNGKNSYMIPGSQTVFQGALVPSAPSDMYAAMGASDQRIYVIPSKKMVIVRMGNASDPANPSFAVSGFDNSLWLKINAVIN